MRRTYNLVNSSSTLPSLSSQLTTNLFVSLGEDALKFLAGVWLQPRSATSGFQSYQYSALKHAAAFFEAHFSSQRYVDFQTVLPAVLVAVQYENRRLREAALECIFALERISQAKNPSAVYAFDAIYGTSSGMAKYYTILRLFLTSYSADLQYLDWSDLGRYIRELQQSSEHLVNDPSYLRILHQRHLLPVKGEAKKEAA